LVRAIYEPWEIEAFARANEVRRLLQMAGAPGMPRDSFRELAISILTDSSRSDAERIEAQGALSSDRGRLESELRAIEKAKAKAEFDALPWAPSDLEVEIEEEEYNPFLEP
jgi:hypothetical protein